MVTISIKNQENPAFIHLHSLVTKKEFVILVTMKEAVTIEQLAEKIEGLADLVKHGFAYMHIKFDGLEVRVVGLSARIEEVASSVETLAIMMAKRFDQQDEKFKNVDENFVAVRQAIVNTYDKFPSQYAFGELSNRVAVLEDIVLPKDI